jgi:HTH-type transcriptional regulator/antitoxin HigA
VGDKRPVDAKLALMLEEVFGVPAQKIPRTASRIRSRQGKIVTHADPGRKTRARLYGDLPDREMIKRGWITAESIRDKDVVEAELIRFFGVDRLDEIEILRTPPNAPKSAWTLARTQLAWLYRVRQIAGDMLVCAYSPQVVRTAIAKLKPLMNSLDGVAKVPRIFGRMRDSIRVG